MRQEMQVRNHLSRTCQPTHS